MPSQATITSKTGPGNTVTAFALTNLTRFDMQLGGKSILFTESEQGDQQWDIAATTTITCSISGGNATIVVSQ
jgi:hypothetical protein